MHIIDFLQLAIKLGYCERGGAIWKDKIPLGDWQWGGDRHTVGMFNIYDMECDHCKEFATHLFINGVEVRPRMNTNLHDITYEVHGGGEPNKMLRNAIRERSLEDNKIREALHAKNRRANP